MVFYRDPLFGLLVLLGPVGSVVWIEWIGAPAAGLVEPAIWSLLLLLAIGPVLEEGVFRGMLQGSLLARHWGQYAVGPVSVANLATAGLFALSHWPRGGPLLVGGVFVPGLIFGWCRERHGQLLSPIFLHAWYNACLILVAIAAHG